MVLHYILVWLYFEESVIYLRIVKSKYLIVYSVIFTRRKKKYFLLYYNFM